MRLARNFLWLIAAFVALGCIVAGGVQASPAGVTPVPLRVAKPAAPSTRDLLRKCAAGDKAACAKLDSAKTPLFCQAPTKSLMFVKRFDCGGGGLPYCDTSEQGVTLYATWFYMLQPGYPVWRTGYVQCQYGTGPYYQRQWALAVGLDPDSGPSKFWMPA